MAELDDYGTIYDCSYQLQSEIVGEYPNRMTIATAVSVETEIARYFDISELSEQQVMQEFQLLNRDYFTIRIVFRQDKLKLYITSVKNTYEHLTNILRSRLYTSAIRAITERTIELSAECSLREENVISKAKKLIKHNEPLLAVVASDDTSFRTIDLIRKEFNVPKPHAQKIAQFLASQDFIEQYTIDFIMKQGVKEIDVDCYDCWSNATVYTDNGEYYIDPETAIKIERRIDEDI